MLQWLWNCLFPITCVGCGQFDCWLCPRCLAAASAPAVITGQNVDRPILGTIYYLGDYRQPILQAAIHGLKYNGWLSLAKPLGCTLAKHVSGPYDWVIPTPLHPRRQRERGFNQAAALASNLPWPVLPALQRTMYTQPQAQLDRAMRQTNVQHAFRLDGRYAHQLYNKTILLVDDVFTTGATTTACAELLRAAGGRNIDVAVVARD